MILPLAFESRIKEQLKEFYPEFIDSLKKDLPISIRINPKKMSNSPAGLTSVLWEPRGYYLPTRPSFTLDPLLHAGAYYVQEASSMFTGYLFQEVITTEKPLKVLDLCGAPGGKSTQLASLLSSDSLLVANEVIRSRAGILNENLVKWGAPNVVITQNDPRDFKRIKNSFDVIVVDAPCSGEGLFRRDSGAVQEWSEANTLLCAQRQQRIIADVWDALTPGGVLIYSTCTFNPGENEKNLNWLSEQFDAESLNINYPESWGIETREYKGMVGYQLFPHKVQGEGFFIGAVKKSGEFTETKNKTKKQLNTASKTIQYEAAQWIKEADAYTIIEQNENLTAIPTLYESFIQQLYGNLNVVHAGIRLAQIKGKKLIPQPELALSWQINQERFPYQELSEYEALQYLKKENQHFKEQQAGYHLVGYKNLPLGWLNNIGNRSNNTYPGSWRIRMDLPTRESFSSQSFL
ncbi:MAG: rRNA methyltransferase [Bacteroidetes bacterium HGW-Bacteroidetes-4]|jgi:16S rRNA C967 or C1407 C5-methylase (RsmB/RsmF family)/NOL1/NOP2/fmu family ribosome biogenesis protein|nr:MAG: rRNA methyltransferase [Bacteroidetes bacterium HGW-Bacteroidetes-4]